mgnify:CR=1 FL=1
MTISVNEKLQLEDLRRLTAFYNFVTHPEQYKDVLDKVAMTLDKMESVISAFATIETANQYLAEANRKQIEVDAYVDAGIHKVAEKQKEFDLYMKKQKATFEVAQTEFSLKSQSLEQERKQLKVQQEQHNKLQQELQEKQEVLRRLEQTLLTQQHELQVKKAKFNELLS